MKNHLLLWGVLAIFVKAVLVTASGTHFYKGYITQRAVPLLKAPDENHSSFCSGSHRLVHRKKRKPFGSTFPSLCSQDEEEGTVLVNNKCKCARVTSRIIPSPEDPSKDIVERNIRIIVPFGNRENISDPTTPLRTKFVYHLSDLCKKCGPVEVELEDQVVTATQSNICDEDNETCYAYDRNKCYTNRVPVSYGGKTVMVETALTPESCYPD